MVKFLSHPGGIALIVLAVFAVLLIVATIAYHVWIEREKRPRPQMLKRKDRDQ